MAEVSIETATRSKIKSIPPITCRTPVAPTDNFGNGRASVLMMRNRKRKEKKCSICKRRKPLTDFHNRSRNRIGKAADCKSCHNARAQKWRRKNPDTAWKIAMRHHLWKKYRITLERYREMLSKQEERCAICKRFPEECGQKVLCVDHDHETGTVRGLLCGPCNTLLGRAQDNSKILRNAAVYLEKWYVPETSFVYCADGDSLASRLFFENAVKNRT